MRELLATSRFAINTQDWHGSAALFTATRNDHLKTAELLLATEKGGLDYKDGSQRDIVRRARQTGNNPTTDILLKYANSAGVEINDDSFPIEYSRVVFDPNGRWCDACTLTIPDTYSRYQCKSCSQGDFHVCLRCAEPGVKCPESSHNLELNEEPRR